MSAALRRLSLLAFVLLTGCTAGVREDRAIHFAADGRQVAFQHGRDGVFVVESEGAEPTKIFQPDADTLAVSAPLWSPTDKRLIFTTAKSADKAKQPGEPRADEPKPEGELISAQPTLYTCWLRGEAKGGHPTPLPLFTVRCGHPGYVAANLAVRWHPDGKHLLYVKQEDETRYGLYEFDLQNETSRRVFPHSGSDLIFDWTPDQTHLVCVVGDKFQGGQSAGVWIGKPGAEKWRRVHEFTDWTSRDLEGLRAARPVWTNDGDRFAFVVKRQNQDDQSATYTLHLGALEPPSVAALSSGDKEIRDLHWRPDGQRLGLLRGGETGLFHLVDAADKSERVAGKEAFCNFLGWNATGDQLAFVARQPLPRDPAKSWAFLLLPDVRARNRVLVAPDAEPERTKCVFSGLQVTFGRWSPTESKLSMWATFRPAYRSWLSHLLDLGDDGQDPLRGLTLRPGDPALVLDPATGERSWKAIDAHEKTQIGHYHLLRGEYAEAWQWYDRAGQPLGDDKRSPRQVVQRFVHGRDALFFQAICLDKLGRGDEARSKRRLFDETFLPELPPVPKTPESNRATPFGAADIQPSQAQLRHWRDLYVAEVFLSLDALEDGERFFRAGLQDAATDADRMSKALVLTQFLLLRDKHEEYAELATDTVLPLLLRSWKPRPPLQPPQQSANLILTYSDGLSLLPLFSSNFLSILSEKQVRALVPRWREQRSAADDDIKRLGVDLFLEAASRRLGQGDEQQAAARRIDANPAQREILGDKGVPGLLDGVRSAPETFAWIRENFSRPR